MDHQDGRASVAPSLDAFEPYTEEYEVVCEKRQGTSRGVSFSKVIEYREIPAVGRCVPTSRVKKCKAVAANSNDTTSGTRRMRSEPGSVVNISALRDGTSSRVEGGALTNGAPPGR